MSRPRAFCRFCGRIVAGDRDACEAHRGLDPYAAPPGPLETLTAQAAALAIDAETRRAIDADYLHALHGEGEPE